MERFVGRKLDVLWERAHSHGGGLRWSGLTPNYLRAVTHTGHEINLHNSVTETSLVAVVEDGLLGEVITQLEPASQATTVELMCGSAA